MKLQCSAQTDVGLVRDHNEDSYGVGEGPQVEQVGQLLVVCDGMGGHAAGEVASRIGVETILAEYYADTEQDRGQAVRRAVERANAEVYRQGRGTMGSTAVVALLHHNMLYVANVGDSRAYLIRGDSIHQISRDHSLVNDQIDAGLLTPEEARVSTIRNIITRALGHQGGVAVDLFRTALLPGDVVLLSSDGLHGLVTDAELARLILQQPLDQAPAVLIALANQRGGHDNITVVLARVEQLDPLDGAALAAQSDAEAETDPALPALAPALHNQKTDRLPALEPAAPAPAAPSGPPSIVSDLATPASAQPERRLTLVGGVLATALLAVLAVVIVYAINLPTPGGTVAPVRLPDSIRPVGPAAAETAVPSPGPLSTGAPGLSATAPSQPSAPSLPTDAPSQPSAAPSLPSAAATP